MLLLFIFRIHTTELTQLVNDKADASQRSMVFFNLFNGITVGNDNSYNGVISYTTLLNIYNDTEHEKTIFNGLISDTKLKQDILNYLTLFHFSRYEATPTKKKPISLKLDPYQNLIGDKSVGALSILKHSNRNLDLILDCLPISNKMILSITMVTYILKI